MIRMTMSAFSARTFRCGVGGTAILDGVFRHPEPSYWVPTLRVLYPVRTRPPEHVSQIATIAFRLRGLTAGGSRGPPVSAPAAWSFAPPGPRGYAPPHTRDYRLLVLLPSRTYFLSKACISLTISGWSREMSVVSSMSWLRS